MRRLIKARRGGRGDGGAGSGGAGRAGITDGPAEMENPGAHADGRRTVSGRSHVARRALISGAAAASAGAAASLALGSAPASAADGQSVLLGETNDSTDSTIISSSQGNGISGEVYTVGASGAYGLDFSTDGGYGVQGYSENGYGVYGYSVNATGISGNAAAAGYPAVYGDSTGGDGLWGNTAADGFCGLYADDQSSGGGVGVYGTSTNGTGISGNATAAGYAAVYGDSAGGDGLWGNTAADGFCGLYADDQSSGGGVGVYGTSTNGTGVLATSANGTALFVEGSAAFSLCGVAAVRGTASKVTISGVPLTASSLVLATPQGAIAGVAVEGVVLDVTAGSFTIHLTQPATHHLPVAWFVIETAAVESASANRKLAHSTRHAPAPLRERPDRHRPRQPGQALADRHRPASPRGLSARHRTVVRTPKALDEAETGKQSRPR
jgi:hypothetical protein